MGNEETPDPNTTLPVDLEVKVVGQDDGNIGDSDTNNGVTYAEPVTPKGSPVETPPTKPVTKASAAKALAGDDNGSGLSTPEKTAEEAAAPEVINDLPGILIKAGLDPATVGATYDETGKLDDASYAALAKIGFGKGMIDTFIEGQVARATAIQARNAGLREQAYALAGGEQQYHTLLSFRDSLPARVKESINSRLEDPDLWRGAVAELQSLAASASHTAGSRPLINPAQRSGIGTGGGFTSSREAATAVDAAKAKHGDSWYKDPTLQAQLSATDPAILKGLPV